MIREEPGTQPGRDTHPNRVSTNWELLRVVFAVSPITHVSDCGHHTRGMVQLPQGRKSVCS